MTQRLRRLAESSPWTLAELQRQFAYDRFLQRLNAGDDGWVLKGAAALLAREVSTRATRDVDLYRRAELVEAETALREAIALDLGDWFTFEASRSRQMTAGVIGLTFALTARIGNREWESFNVDLVDEAAGMTGEPETAPALARIDLAELDQPGYRVWPLADHVADKVTATFATYGRTNRASTRVQGSDRPRGDSPLRSPISEGRDRRGPSSSQSARHRAACAIRHPRHGPLESELPDRSAQGSRSHRADAGRRRLRGP